MSENCFSIRRGLGSRLALCGGLQPREKRAARRLDDSRGGQGEALHERFGGMLTSVQDRVVKRNSSGAHRLQQVFKLVGDLTYDYESARQRRTLDAVNAAEESINQLALSATGDSGGTQLVDVLENPFDQLFNLDQEFALGMVHEKIVNRKS